MFVSKRDPVKIFSLTLKNASTVSRNLTISHYTELVMEETKEKDQDLLKQKDTTTELF